MKNQDAQDNWKYQDREYHSDFRVVVSYDRRITKKFALEHRYFTVDKWITELRKKGKQGRVLDFGCGTGDITVRLLKPGYKAVSADASFAMVELTRSKCADFPSQQAGVVADVEILPFKEKTFAAVFCAGVLHHIPDIEKGVENQMRVLEDGGYLFITEPYKHKSPVSWGYHVIVSSVKRIVWAVRNAHRETQERELSEKDIDAISRLLQANGFEFRVEYLIYWPVVCGYLPVCFAYPLMRFLNLLNRGCRRGDSVMITAKKP